MACFTKARQQVKANVYEVANAPVYSYLQPQDFVPIFYNNILLYGGLNLLRQECHLLLTNEPICGGDAGMYEGCENSEIGSSILKMQYYKPRWVTYSDDEKERLIMHELGHAILRLPHKEGPAIMQPVALPGPYYAANKQALIKQMVSDFMYGGIRV